MNRFLSRSMSIWATRLLVTAFLALALSSTASAAPPPGMRWSDHAWGRGNPGSSSYDTRLRGSGSVTGTYRFRYVTPSYPVAPSYTVMPHNSGVWVRGADGVYRWWPTPVGGIIR